MATAAKVSAELQRVARSIDNQLEEIAGERVGFMLLVWAGGEVNYVSTDPDRANAVKAMRELIGKWESGAPGIPAHKRN